MDLSIIIPFANEKNELLFTIESILENRGVLDIEIIVINDASDDGWDYESLMKRFSSVIYYKNFCRIGVAACRDIGVSLCKANKFLLLDSHMRLFNSDSLVKLINCLERNPQSVICSQTIGIGESLNHFEKTPFAAYLEFVGDHGGLYAMWNLNDYDPSNSILEVPCVLGAAYAANKQYWIYLKGLSGLISYGSDEAYISLKVWMSGGKCLLVKDVIVGHLYRKDPPYLIRHVDYVYNKILITILLLPTILRYKVLNNLSAEFKVQFNYSLVKLHKNAYRIIELNEYYKKILDFNLFDRFYNLNVKCEEFSLTNILKPERRLRNERTSKYFADFDIDSIGLYNGKMGGAILSYIKGNVTQADEFIENVIVYLENNTLNVQFDNGLLGIAWGFLFLADNGFIEFDTDRTIAEFDDRIFCYYDINHYEDWSFGKGILGVIYYATIRLYQNKSLLYHYPVFFKFLYKIVRERFLDESSNLFEVDFPFIALLYVIYFDENYKLVDDILSIDMLMSMLEIENSNSFLYKELKAIGK